MIAGVFDRPAAFRPRNCPSILALIGFDAPLDAVSSSPPSTGGRNGAARIREIDDGSLATAIWRRSAFSRALANEAARARARARDFSPMMPRDGTGA